MFSRLDLVLSISTTIVMYTQCKLWKSQSLCISWRKHRRFLINVSGFEDILDLKYMVICFIIIKTTISHEFIMFTHTMMIGQLHTSSIDLYGKHAQFYNVKHKLNSSVYCCRRLSRHNILISRHFWKVQRISR